MQVFISKSVNLLAPDGDEVIYPGSEYTISWDAVPHIVTFNLMLSLDQGATWNPIPEAQGITGNTFAWLVPRLRSNKRKCLIKVTGFDSKGRRVGSDRSAVPFAIEVVKLTAPSDPGISMTSGETYDITWIVYDTIRLVEAVELYYTRNGTAVPVTWKLIDAFKVSEYPGTYPWQVPQSRATRNKWKVKVVLKGAAGRSIGVDTSDSYFEVQASL
jgi:hypothetical protein